MGHVHPQDHQVRLRPSLPPTSLLVESVQTERGPRQRTICSLGSVPPAPPEHWPSLVREIEAAQSGQFPLTDPSPALRRLLRRRPTLGAPPVPREGVVPPPADDEPVRVRPGRVTVEQAREAGPVHLGHQFWLRLGVGVRPKTCFPFRSVTVNIG